MTPPSAYQDFWAGVGERFPDLGGAASTHYYAENERRLFSEHFPPLAGLRILKTDLWDEAKNTRILAWAADRGARAFGIDISAPTVNQARAAFTTDSAPLRAATADVRALPFRDASFDAIYSMGTIEHFAETERALEEIARVLKPGGRAIVGVPNRHDPFLRPLFATVLQAVGLYGYGYEKSYSRRRLRQMLERAGLDVVAETAILFVPGWLRMLDLACYSWCRPLAAVTGALLGPFVFLDRHVPAVRRHGYLLATVVMKPERMVEIEVSPRLRAPSSLTRCSESEARACRSVPTLAVVIPIAVLVLVILVVIFVAVVPVIMVVTVMVAVVVVSVHAHRGTGTGGGGLAGGHGHRAG